MLLDLAEALKHPGNAYPFQLAASLSPDMLPDGVTLAGSVKAYGDMTALADKVALIGRIEADLRIPCARCLKPVAVSLAHDYGETLVRSGLDAPEAALDADEPEYIVYEGTTCDLTQSIAGALVLEIPMRVLCRDSCLGLCQVCGADINVTPCGCGKPLVSPFAVLADLIIDDSDKEV